MDMPRWDDPEAARGAMVRSALWLVQVVGEGNSFTKNELRDAFPGVSQIDRRVRDLRDFGWVIHTSSDDASLLREDQRFVRAGVAVWNPKLRREAATRSSLTAKERQAILARDDFMCTSCGISGGESYPDSRSQSAVLAITTRRSIDPSGRELTEYFTECSRCRAAGPSIAPSADEFLGLANSLGEADRRRLLNWIGRGRKGATDLDRAWNSYLRLSADSKSAARASLSSA